MTLNPLQTFWNRKADRAFREEGWGPLQTWPVPRAQGGPLVFQLRLPLNVELVDLAALAGAAEGAHGAPESLAAAAQEVQRAARVAGTIVVGALRERQDDGESEILASLSVAFSDGKGKLDPADYVPADADGDVRPPEVSTLSDNAIRISRLTSVTPPGAEAAQPNLSVQYLVQSRYGVLSFAYATARMDMIAGGGGRSLFRKITETGYIGERPKSY